MANIAQMVNVLQAMIMTDHERMVLTPTYHVFRMYAPFQDATLIPVQLDAGTYSYGNITLPRVDAIAARDSKGNIWLAVVNLDPAHPAKVHAAFAGATMQRAHGQVLTAAQVDSVNTFDSPHAVQPVPLDAMPVRDGVVLELPAKSVAVLQVRP
jgi:alpha-N-arabinofuranosidase